MHGLQEIKQLNKAAVAAASKRVAVVDNESGECIRVVRRFHTVVEAENFIALLSDTDKVHRGGYGIDAPEAWINP